MKIVWILVCMLIVQCQSAVFKLEVTKGQRKVIDLGAFGFAGKGSSNFTMKITRFEYFGPDQRKYNRPPAPVGFSLEERDTINTARLEQNVQYDPGTCFIDWKRPERVVVALPSYNWTVVESKKQVPLRLDTSESSPQLVDFSDELSAGFLALFFFNCNEDSSVSFKVEVSEFNWNGNSKDYLSLGISSLPEVFFGFFLAYSVCFGCWVYLLSKNFKFAHKVHYLMGCLVFLKAVSLFFEAVQYHVIKMYGTHFLSADIPYYFFLTLKGIMLFVVILLIGTGWSFVKPFLNERDKHILAAVLPLQISVNVAMIVVDTLNEGNRSWSTWRDVLRILDIVCCCAVLLPIVWSIRNLREAEITDGKVIRNLSRLRQFRTFYIMVVAYIYFTRIIVVLIRSALHYKATWVGPFIFELGTFFFYFFTGVKFKPMNETLLGLDDDTSCVEKDSVASSKVVTTA